MDHVKHVLSGPVRESPDVLAGIVHRVLTTAQSNFCKSWGRPCFMLVYWLLEARLESRGIVGALLDMVAAMRSLPELSDHFWGECYWHVQCSCPEFPQTL